MRKTKLIAALCAVRFAASVVMPWGAAAVNSDGDQEQTEEVTEVARMFDVTIDGSTCNTAENSLYRGFGYISANNSSRLLLDYKQENPEAYDKLLMWLFDPDGGVRMNHIKIEMGADINSSSGTEPSALRSLDEEPDVTRGAGFQLAADALKINPDITLELLSWGAPAFVKNADDIQDRREKRYLWFKKTLDAAYENYGLEFDYIAPNYNEKAVDAGWIKYFAEALHGEKDTPYSYKDIKIVAADEDDNYNLAAMMLEDEELMNAVDVIGVHYTSTSDENMFKCKNEYGKELWYSEGLPPAGVSQYAVNADGSGICGVNSMLDVADRIINMYPNGGYTMYEFQPPVAAYYSGATYYPKQLVTANEPWSGRLEAGSGMYLCEHFSLFTKQGWQFVDSACYGDGREESHVMYDTTNNYMTLADPETGDYSVILANNTSAERTYSFTVKNLAKASSAVQVWETRGPDEQNSEYNANYFKNVMAIEPEKTDGGYSYQLTVKPYSLVTVSTLEVQPADFGDDTPCTRLELPYTDDFEYADYYEGYLASRGYAPRYTTDQSGAFEVEETEEGRVLTQQITDDLRGVEWALTPEPVTTLGDDTWSNYTVSARVRLAEGADEENYVGIGLRYINSSAAKAKSGYRIELAQDGKWRLCNMGEVLAEGETEKFDPTKWHTLSITAEGDVLSAAVDGVQTASVTIGGAATFSGRAALYSAYYRNSFDDLAVMPVDMTGYVVRTDNLDSAVSFEGEWEHNTMDSFQCHNRTASYAGEGASFAYEFEGDSLALIGSAQKAVISVELDGETVSDHEEVSSSNKQAFWRRYGLGYSEHTVRVTVHSGTLGFDAIEYGSSTLLKNGDPEGGMISETLGGADKNDGIKNVGIGISAKTAIGAAAVCAIGIAAVVVKKKRKKNGG